MAENKHTPTPWIAIEASTGWTISDLYGREIAREMNNGRDMGESDAKHIVHCVNTHDELVEALELASREIATSLSLIYADTGKDYDTILREYPNYQKILSALKKATN